MTREARLEAQRALPFDSATHKTKRARPCDVGPTDHRTCKGNGRGREAKGQA